MVRKKSFIWLRLIFFFSIITYLLGLPSYGSEKHLNAGTFDFSLKALDGKEICLKDYRGKKMVHLLFWATWCPYCLMEMPKLKKLYHAMGDKPYEILAIDVGINDSLKRIKKIQEQYQIPCKIFLDEKGKVSKRCGIISVPMHIIIDKEGIIRDRFYQLSEDPTNYINRIFSQ